MSLEHFKKQVLLLHSEQSTLDNLSSGFNERYTVHCATSGIEALNTLGETRIDVIVTAQDLPGMSGLDALREAKKRSPDTIGILLAGNDSGELEALVGDQAVFQIVRGGVTPDSLKSLIDNASRQARLLALAESANDTMASPDEPVPEHIVMETGENGSAIVSDGTGRLPVLDPQKVSVAADVRSRGVDVLVLTRDEEFLTTIQESARGMHGVIHTNTLAQADDAIRKDKVGVAIVDAAMVGSNIEKVTMHLRTQAPRLVAIVAGRRDDGEMLMDLINRGKVYRFLLKPVSPGRSRLAIEASVKHHLEAPGTAFKVSGNSAPTPKTASKSPPEEQPKAAPKPAPEAKQKSWVPPKPAPAAKAPESITKPKTAPAAKAPESKTKPRIAPTIVPKAQTSKPEFATAEAEVATVVSADGGSGGSLLSNRRILGLGAVALVVIVGLSFWMFSGTDEPVVEEESLAGTPLITEVDPVFLTEVVTPQELGVNDLINEAQLAAAAGQIHSPPGGSAIELYLSALDMAPGNPVAQLGLEEVVEQALGMAETAMLERRSEDAAAALERVELADPENARLPFLNAQLAQMRLRNSLNDARLAIRESRFEDATSALDRARALADADTTEIDAVADELSGALSEQRVDEVLAQANARLEEGNLIAPSNDNARFYYELVLSNDPGNTAAHQGLIIVASKLVFQAREQIDEGNFDSADALLADARRLDPLSSELVISTTALNAARDRREQDARRAAERVAAERDAAEKAAAEQAAAVIAAEEQAAAVIAAEEQAAAVIAAEEQAATVIAAEEQAAAVIVAEEQAVAVIVAEEQAVAEIVAEEQAVAERATAETAVVEASLQATDESVVEDSAEELLAAVVPQERATLPEPSGSPVSVSSLRRTKYVAPKYPRSAQRRSLSGWVDVVFTVGIDGTVVDVSVRDSNPGETFVGSATKAVESWEFEPVIEDGVAVRKRAAVRMMFALE